MGTLYNKLTETKKIFEEAKIFNMAEQRIADAESLKKEKQEIYDFVEKLKDQLINAIQNYEIPAVIVKDTAMISWINDAYYHRVVRFSEAWDTMNSFFKSENLRIIIENDSNSGNIIVGVDLIKAGTRGTTELPSSATHGIKFDLGVGEYRG